MRPFIAFVVATVACGFGLAVAREWTSSNGKFKIEAEFVAVKNGKVVLEKPDGTYLSVPLEKLSPEDIAFIEEETGAAVEVPREETDANDGANARVAKLKGEKPDDPPGEARNFGEMGWGIEALAFSPDGRYLAAGTKDDSVALFDVSEGKKTGELKNLKILGDIKSCAYTPDGKRLMVGGSTGVVQILQVDGRGEIKDSGEQFVGHSDDVSCLSLSRDGEFALSGGKEKRVRYWRTEKPKEIASFAGFEGEIKACLISPDGATGIATDGATLLSINLKTEKTTVAKLTNSWATGQFAAIAPNGRLVAVGDGYDVRLWELPSGRELPRMKDREIQWSGEFTPDSTRLVTGGSAKLNVWDVKKQARIGVVATDGFYYVQCMATSPDNWHTAAIPGSAGAKLQVFRVHKE